MKQVAAFELDIHYICFEVHDPDVDVTLVYDFRNQDYEFKTGKANFPTCGDCSHAIIEVWLAEKIQVGSDIHYAVVVPFPVGRSGVCIMNVIQSQIVSVPIPEGRYALLYELKLRGKDNVYLNSEWYAYDQECQMQGAFCRLTFIPQDLVEAQELIKWDSNYFLYSNPLYADRGLSPIPSDTI